MSKIKTVEDVVEDTWNNIKSRLFAPPDPDQEMAIKVSVANTIRQDRLALREEILEEEAKEADGQELAKWLHENHEPLGPYIWEECCRVYGFGGTPEANLAYKKIVLSVKKALTKAQEILRDKITCECSDNCHPGLCKCKCHSFNRSVKSN